VENCIVSGSIISEPDIAWDLIHPNYCGGVAGDNKGTVTNCRFDGRIVGSMAGGIVGATCGTVTNNQVLTGIVSNGGVNISTGAVIGFIYSPNGINYNGVVVSGNTFSIPATGQQYGIGEDRRLSPYAPSNNGTTAIN
jgi:hypothetical protein